MKKKYVWIPETPGGTMLDHLSSHTEDAAWKKLLVDARHMPYNGKAGFVARGYKVLRWERKNER